MAARTLLLTTLLLVSAAAATPDFLVAIQNRLELGRIDQSSSDQLKPDHLPGQIVALEWDPINSEQVFFSASDGLRASIHAFNLTDNSSSLVISQNYTGAAEGLAYDPFDGTLYWTESVNRTISYVNISEPSVEVLHRFRDGRPWGIAIDVCQRHIYWSNVNHSSPSIDHSDLDGGLPFKLVTTDLYQPRGLTLDSSTSLLYWVDNQPGIHYRVECISLDGSYRRVLHQGEYQNPFAITLTASRLLWTDWSHKAVWEMRLDTPELAPRQALNFTQTPFGLVALKSDPVCSTLEVTVVHSLPHEIEEEPSSSELASADYVCLDFCLHGGKCRMEENGEANCTCPAGYFGARCEKTDCKCQNGGTCVSGHCLCNSSFSGAYCEIPMPSMQTEAVAHRSDFIHLSKTVFGMLIGIIVALMLLSLTLLFLILRLRRRGRHSVHIKRTKVKKPNRNNCGIISNAAVLSVDIEDCCNMNICETPCYETGVKYQRPSKSDDQACLLPPKDSA